MKCLSLTLLIALVKGHIHYHQTITVFSIVSHFSEWLFITSMTSNRIVILLVPEYKVINLPVGFKSYQCHSREFLVSHQGSPSKVNFQPQQLLSIIPLVNLCFAHKLIYLVLVVLLTQETLWNNHWPTPTLALWSCLVIQYSMFQNHYITTFQYELNT